MTRRHKLLLALIMPGTLALAAVLSAAFARPVPFFPISDVPPQFDAARALTDTIKLVADYPDRVVASPANARARDWIITRFTELDLPVDTLPFTVTVASQAKGGLQVWATSPGASDEIILVTAHYDTSPTAPADNAAGLAVLLELARIFSTEAHHRTLLFMASDSEVYGPAWGAKNFIEQFDRRNKVVAVLDLNYPNPEAALISLDSAALHQGYAPLWLRQIKTEIVAHDQDGVAEFFDRALPFHTSDAAAFLRAHVPAVRFNAAHGPFRRNGSVNLSGRPIPAWAGIQRFNPHLGYAAETWLRTVDALDPIPSNASHYFRLNRTHYLSGDVIDYLQLLLFAPLFLITVIAWRKSRPRADELQPEFTAFLGLVVTGLDGYAVAYSLVSLGWLPRYEMYPASPGDPFLLHPTGWAALAIYGTAVFFGWLIFRPFRGWGRLADILQIPHRRVTLLLIFSALVIFVWYLNGFAASALLGLAAYLWPWIEPRRTPAGKALNAALALAGALPFAVVVYFFASNFPIGPWWWYLTLGAAYGLFPLLGVIAFLCGAALLVRFLRLGWRDV